MTREQERETIRWIRSRPPVVQDLLVKFPPNCTVKPKRSLMCPRVSGQVVSYYESGTVSVVEDGNPIRGQCEPGWLEAVSYKDGLTPDFVRAAIAEVDA